MAGERAFVLLQNVQVGFGPQSTGVKQLGQLDHLHLVQRLRMNSAVHMSALYAFQACTGTFAFAESSHIRIVLGILYKCCFL